MTARAITVSLPIADRATTYAFYRQVLDLEAIGEPADDGIPEPLQFELGPGVHLMFVPTGGFGWVIGDRRDVAPRDTSECVLAVGVADPAGVDATAARAEEAGATIVMPPGPQPWGYVTTFTDPDDHLWMVSADSPS